MLRFLTAFALACCTFAAQAAADANQASQAELEAVKGIGPTLATRILDERKKGSFKDWSDLISRVGGIGEKSAARLSGNGLTVNGAAFEGAAGESPARQATARAGGAPRVIPCLSLRRT